MQGRAALPKAALPWLERADAVYVCAASLWKAAIKAASRKLVVDIAALDEQLADAGFAQLPMHLLTCNAALRPDTDLVIVVAA